MVADDGSQTFMRPFYCAFSFSCSLEEKKGQYKRWQIVIHLDNILDNLGNYSKLKIQNLMICEL